MGRQPENVMVLAFREGESGYEFLVLHRADSGIWQGVSGGLEAGEMVVEAAYREVSEEIGVLAKDGLVHLDSRGSIPANMYKAYRTEWSNDVFIIPQYAFGMALDKETPITLSREHDEYRWVSFDEAHALIKWDNNKTALWELGERLRDGNITKIPNPAA